MSEDGNKKSSDQGTTGAVGPTVPGARGVPKSARQHTLVGFPTERGGVSAPKVVAPPAGVGQPAVPKPAPQPATGAWSSKKPDAAAKRPATSSGAASAFKVPTPGQVVPKGRRASQARMPAATAKKPSQPRTPAFGAAGTPSAASTPETTSAQPAPSTAHGKALAAGGSSEANQSPAPEALKAAARQQTMGQGPASGGKKKDVAFAKTLMMTAPAAAPPVVSAPVEPPSSDVPEEAETAQIAPPLEPATQQTDLSAEAAASIDPALSSSAGAFDGTGQTMPPPAGFNPSEATASASEASGGQPFDPTADTAPPPAPSATGTAEAAQGAQQPAAVIAAAAPLVPPKGPPTADHAVMPVPGRATPAPFEAPRQPSSEMALPEYDSAMPEAMKPKKGGKGMLYAGLAAVAAMSVVGFVMFGGQGTDAPPTGPVGTQPTSSAPAEDLPAPAAEPVQAAEAASDDEAGGTEGEAPAATDEATAEAAAEERSAEEAPAPDNEVEGTAEGASVALTLPEVPRRIERMPARKRRSLAVRHLRHANRLMGQRKWENAKRSLDEALALDPESATGSVAMSRWALQGQGDPALALAWAERATTLSPNSASAYVAVGAVLEAQAKPKEALEAYQQALKSSRRHPVAKRKVRALRRATR